MTTGGRWSLQAIKPWRGLISLLKISRNITGRSHLRSNKGFWSLSPISGSMKCDFHDPYSAPAELNTHSLLHTPRLTGGYSHLALSELHTAGLLPVLGSKKDYLNHALKSNILLDYCLLQAWEKYNHIRLLQIRDAKYHIQPVAVRNDSDGLTANGICKALSISTTR